MYSWIMTICMVLMRSQSGGSTRSDRAGLASFCTALEIATHIVFFKTHPVYFKLMEDKQIDIVEAT